MRFQHCLGALKLICELLIVVTAIEGLFYAADQARELRQQTREFHRQTELQNRPFLSFLPDRFYMRFDEPGESEAEMWCDLDYTLKNTGPVPAFNVRIEQFDIEVNRPVIHSEDIPSRTETIAVFPGDPLTESRRFTLDRQVAKEYHRGAKHFEVHARISYRGVEVAPENPYWFEVRAESRGFGRSFILIRTDGN